MMVALNASADKLGIAHIVYPSDRAEQLRGSMRIKQQQAAEAHGEYFEMETAAYFYYGMCKSWARGWCENKAETGGQCCSDCKGKRKGWWLAGCRFVHL